MLDWSVQCTTTIRHRSSVQRLRCDSRRQGRCLSTLCTFWATVMKPDIGMISLLKNSANGNAHCSKHSRRPWIQGRPPLAMHELIYPCLVFFVVAYLIPSLTSLSIYSTLYVSTVWLIALECDYYLYVRLYLHRRLIYLSSQECDTRNQIHLWSLSETLSEIHGTNRPSERLVVKR